MIRERGVGEKMLIQMIAKAIYDDDGETAALDPSEDKWFIDYLPDTQNKIYDRKTISRTIKY